MKYAAGKEDTSHEGLFWSKDVRSLRSAIEKTHVHPMCYTVDLLMCAGELYEHISKWELSRERKVWARGSSCSGGVMWCWNTAHESKCCVDSSRRLWDIYFMAYVVRFLCSYSSLKYQKQLSACHWTFWAIKSKTLQCVAPTFRLDASWTHHSWMKNDSQTRAVAPSEENMSAASDCAWRPT